MSLDAAISQIDNVLALQQMVANPATAASALAANPTAAGGSAGSSSATAFADMLSEAQLTAGLSGSGGAGLTDTSPDTSTDGLTDPISSGVSDSLASALAGSGSTSVTGATGATTATGAPTATGVTTATGATTATDEVSANAPAQVQAMVTQANSLIGEPYVWGGGHDGWGPQTGYDCSGFVSKVLHAAGYLSAPQDTQTLPSQPGIETGPGQYVTIYDRTDAGMSDDHVIINIGGQFYESGGEHGAWGGGGGVEKIATPPQSYLDTFNLVLHPEGL